MKIQDILDNKPSNLVQNMVDGLKEQNSRDDFRVTMGSFGHSIEEVCFGCAATCALQKTLDKNFTASTIGSMNLATRAKAMDLPGAQVKLFEYTVEVLRMGYIGREFAHYFDLEAVPQPDEPITPLTTADWQERLPAYEAYAAQLRKVGL